ncbi:TPA: AAA family ATPase [Candidatus Avigastranaerophilus faecigallinarum]|nr:AAA family ATPase [Candidatus Avigastranaerophilus faecigallinarum]
MKNNRKIIVFSGKQFSGKDTVAKILLKKFKSFKRVGIADAIKMQYARKNGLTLEEIEQNKSQYRQDLIELGDWGRAQNPDYWLNSIIAYEGNIIVTDVRVRHELDLFKKQGAYSVRVEASEETRSKRGTLSSKNDNTETALDNIKDWDYVIYNNGTYEELLKNTQELINDIQIKLGKEL